VCSAPGPAPTPCNAYSPVGSCYEPRSFQLSCVLGDPNLESSRCFSTIVDFVEWDVTDYIMKAKAAGRTEVSFVIMKDRYNWDATSTSDTGTSGKIRYFTKEGAAYWASLGFGGGNCPGDNGLCNEAELLRPRIIVAE
jgi:hypothetical protein